MRFALMAALLLSLAPAWADTWITTWGAAPDQAGPPLKAQTVRQIVRTSAGGEAVRVRLSNLFGTQPVTIGPVHVAMRGAGASIKPGSDHALTFGGAARVSIAPGQSVVSDAVVMTIPALQELAISLYLPEDTGPSTIHGEGLQTVYMLRGADMTAAPDLPGAETDDSRYFLTDVDVLADGDAQTVVAMGDSITDGVGSALDRNARWPDWLAAGLNTGRAVGVVNAGIAGNRILHDGAKPFIGPSILSRFERDALSKPGVRWIVLLSGSNDISATDMLSDREQKVTAQQIIDGLRTLARRAHEKGIKVCAATLLPLAGVRKPFIDSAAGAATREAVNTWIRSASAFDAVADFNAAVRDPAHPDRLLPAFDSGDHLHPNGHGYEAMAAAAGACHI